MKVYLDNCCYNCPYDDQSQLRISLETQAKLQIQSWIKSNEISLSASYVLMFENSRNPYELRQKAIRNFVKNNVDIFVDLSSAERVKAIADEIIMTGVKAADAHHIACAILAESDYFITTDDRLLKYKNDKIRITDPIEFVKEWEVSRNDGNG